MKGIYDDRIGTTRHINEDFLHWRRSQHHRLDCNDSQRNDRHWLYFCPKMGTPQAVPLVYVTPNMDTGEPPLNGRRK